MESGSGMSELLRAVGVAAQVTDTGIFTIMRTTNLNKVLIHSWVGRERTDQIQRLMFPGMLVLKISFEISRANTPIRVSEIFFDNEMYVVIDEAASRYSQ
jgi:hypothetical protein